MGSWLLEFLALGTMYALIQFCRLLAEKLHIVLVQHPAVSVTKL